MLLCDYSFRLPDMVVLKLPFLMTTPDGFDMSRVIICILPFPFQRLQPLQTQAPHTPVSCPVLLDESCVKKRVTHLIGTELLIALHTTAPRFVAVRFMSRFVGLVIPMNTGVNCCSDFSAIGDQLLYR